MPSEDRARSLRLLVVGDFGGAGGRKTPVRIDKERFDAALEAVRPTLSLSVPQRLGAGPPTLELELEFHRLADFAPAGLVERIPALARLRAGRELAAALERGEIDLARFRREAEEVLSPEWIERVARDGESAAAGEAAGATPAPAPAPPASLLDEIVSEAGAPRREDDTRAAARRLVDALTPRRPRAAARPAAGPACAALDAQIGAQLDEILEAPAFRALEAAWRGARLLVDRSDARAGIAIDLLCATVDEAPGRLEALLDAEEADLVLADYELDASARDLERAEALAAAGERTQTPVAAAVAPGFFGLGSWRELARARDPAALFDEPAYADWRSLRKRDLSRWLVLLANRIALRARYGADGEAARDLAYRQMRGEGLFGSAVWGLGAAVARAFARTGACLQFAGARHGLLPDLALCPTASDERAAPVEGVFPSERREDLERIGLAAVQLYQRDVAFLGPVATFHQPERYPDAEASADAAQQATLAYQLFASRLVKLLGRLVPELTGLESSEAVARELRAAVLRFASTAEKPLPADHVGIRLRPNADDGALTDVALRVQPEFTIAGRPVNVMMSFSLRL